MDTAINDVLERFKQRGHLEYGESVTQLQHALQTAVLAEGAGASDTLVAAALLHDFGHLLHAEDAADRGIDACHEESGAAYLASRFQPAATEPGRLHVAAKRYLCAVDAAYLSGFRPPLSAASSSKEAPIPAQNQTPLPTFPLQRKPYSCAGGTTVAKCQISLCPPSNISSQP